MGYGWFVSSPTDIGILHSIEHWVSSTRAECFAIFTSLLICPKNSTVNIYTDSQSTIPTFNSLFDHKMTDCRLQKCNNVLVSNLSFKNFN